MIKNKNISKIGILFKPTKILTKIKYYICLLQNPIQNDKNN